jgi:hypothetical protein
MSVYIVLGTMGLLVLIPLLRWWVGLVWPPPEDR